MKNIGPLWDYHQQRWCRFEVDADKASLFIANDVEVIGEGYEKQALIKSWSEVEIPSDLYSLQAYDFESGAAIERSISIIGDKLFETKSVPSLSDEKSYSVEQLKYCGSEKAMVWKNYCTFSHSEAFPEVSTFNEALLWNLFVKRSKAIKPLLFIKHPDFALKVSVACCQRAEAANGMSADSYILDNVSSNGIADLLRQFRARRGYHAQRGVNNRPHNFHGSARDNGARSVYRRNGIGMSLTKR